MRRAVWLLISALVLTLAASSLAWRATASAEAAGQASTPQGSDVLPALLSEVRALRVAMEQMATAGPRVQLALGRLQLQEQRMAAIVRRLEELRNQMANAEREQTANEEQVKMMEAGMRGGNMPPEEREEVEKMVASIRRQAAQAAANYQRLAADEAGVAAELASEQSRWADINQRVEELERALGRR